MVVLIFISLKTGAFDDLFMGLLAIHISYFVKCMFISPILYELFNFES